MSWLGTRLGPALAVVMLTFISGLQWTRLSHTSEGTTQLQAVANHRPTAGGASSASSSAVPAPGAGATAGAAASGNAASVNPAWVNPASGSAAGGNKETDATIEFNVSRLVKGRHMRVGISSPDLPTVSYSLLNCRTNARRTRIETCQIVVDPNRERQFVTALFGDQKSEAPIQQFQQEIGTPASKVDGRWGPYTRARFVRRVVEQPRKSVRVDLTKTGPTILLFDSPARGRKPRSHA